MRFFLSIAAMLSGMVLPATSVADPAPWAVVQPSGQVSCEIATSHSTLASPDRLVWAGKCGGMYWRTLDPQGVVIGTAWRDAWPHGTGADQRFLGVLALADGRLLGYAEARPIPTSGNDGPGCLILTPERDQLVSFGVALDDLHDCGTVRATSDGGFVVGARTTRHDFVLRRYDGSGSLRWSRKIASTDLAAYLEVRGNDTWLAYTAAANGVRESRLLMFSSAGELQLDRALGLTGDEGVVAFAISDRPSFAVADFARIRPLKIGYLDEAHGLVAVELEHDWPQGSTVLLRVSGERIIVGSQHWEGSVVSVTRVEARTRTLESAWHQDRAGHVQSLEVSAGESVLATFEGSNALLRVDRSGNSIPLASIVLSGQQIRGANWIGDSENFAVFGIFHDGPTRTRVATSRFSNDGKLAWQDATDVEPLTPTFASIRALGPDGAILSSDDDLRPTIRRLGADGGEQVRVAPYADSRSAEFVSFAEGSGALTVVASRDLVNHPGVLFIDGYRPDLSRAWRSAQDAGSAAMAKLAGDVTVAVMTRQSFPAANDLKGFSVVGIDGDGATRFQHTAAELGMAEISAVHAADTEAWLVGFAVAGESATTTVIARIDAAGHSLIVGQRDDPFLVPVIRINDDGSVLRSGPTPRTLQRLSRDAAVVWERDLPTDDAWVEDDAAGGAFHASTLSSDSRLTHVIVGPSGAVSESAVQLGHGVEKMLRTTEGGVIAGGTSTSGPQCRAMVSGVDRTMRIRWRWQAPAGDGCQELHAISTTGDQLLVTTTAPLATGPRAIVIHRFEPAIFSDSLE